MDILSYGAFSEAYQSRWANLRVPLTASLGELKGRIHEPLGHMQIDPVGASASELEQRVHGPERRGERVGDAAESTAGHAAQLVEAEWDVVPVADPHQSGEPRCQPV